MGHLDQRSQFSLSFDFLHVSSTPSLTWNLSSPFRIIIDSYSITSVRWAVEWSRTCCQVSFANSMISIPSFVVHTLTLTSPLLLLSLFFNTCYSKADSLRERTTQQGSWLGQYQDLIETLRLRTLFSDALLRLFLSVSDSLSLQFFKSMLSRIWCSLLFQMKVEWCWKR